MPAVHRAFRTSLASAPRFVASAAGDDERRALIANYYANVIDFLDVHHEGEEELVFPLLAERAPGSKGIVDVAFDDHHAVVGQMQTVKERVAAWQDKGDTAAQDLIDALRELDEILVPHLDREEAEILPLAGEHLSIEEWGALPGHAMGNFKGDKVWLIIGLVRENFTQAQRDMMLEHMPPPARQMWESVGEASFNQLIAEVRQGS
jgi:hypothetical protein